MAPEQSTDAGSDAQQPDAARSIQRNRQITFAVAGILGTVLIVGGGYVAYGWVMKLDPPDPKTASGREIATFLGHEDGFTRLTIGERRAFMQQLLTTQCDSARREDMRKALATMTDDEKEICREAVWDVGFDIFFREVDEYRATPREKRAAFIDRKIAEYYQIHDELSGQLKGGGQKLALLDGSWLEGMPRKGKDIVKMILVKTDPKDRARMTPYIEAIGSRMAELKLDPRELERIRSRYAPSDSAEADDEG